MKFDNHDYPIKHDHIFEDGNLFFNQMKISRIAQMEKQAEMTNSR